MHKLDADALARLASLWRNKYAGQAIPLAALLCDRSLRTVRDDGERALEIAAGEQELRLEIPALADEHLRVLDRERRQLLECGLRPPELPPPDVGGSA